ncbi:DUF302 domain-containing protein [Serratia sp. FDAARGOS_506]|uniref:DUF302 domain-containing protein n=1 Tax=Serratia sp. FDAARGOS_506 TaxID=2420306 RepID=UPI0020A3CBFA|nr:DUF302 domain-containing protein [Serratia sp. FDAARGOS_506]
MGQETRTVESAYAYQETRQRIISTAEQKGVTLFAELDHARAAREHHLAMPPTTVLVLGNPLAGTPLMLARPALALDLPFRVLIAQDERGKTQVSYHPAESLKRSAGADERQIAALRPLERLVEAAIR